MWGAGSHYWTENTWLYFMWFCIAFLYVGLTNHDHIHGLSHIILVVNTIKLIWNGAKSNILKRVVILVVNSPICVCFVNFARIITSSYGLLLCQCLTCWGRDKMAAILQTAFSNAFSWMKMYEFLLKFLWSLFPRVQLTLIQHWFR